MQDFHNDIDTNDIVHLLYFPGYFTSLVGEYHHCGQKYHQAI
jgi:hypothetical protein